MGFEVCPAPGVSYAKEMGTARFQFGLRAIFIATVMVAYLAAAWSAGAFGAVAFLTAAVATLSLGLYQLARPKQPFLRGLSARHPPSRLPEGAEPNGRFSRRATPRAARRRRRA